jgi:hypothetical protein
VRYDFFYILSSDDWYARLLFYSRVMKINIFLSIFKYFFQVLKRNHIKSRNINFNVGYSDIGTKKNVLFQTVVWCRWKTNLKRAVDLYWRVTRSRVHKTYLWTSIDYWTQWTQYRTLLEQRPRFSCCGRKEKMITVKVVQNYS